MNYYKDLLTGDMEDYAVYAPFPLLTRGKTPVLWWTDVSSRYTRRGEEEYRRMAEYICRTVQSHKGNYLVFFPSYQMLEAVFPLCLGEPGLLCIRQDSGMDEAEREQFLEEFEKGTKGKPGGLLCDWGGDFLPKASIWSTTD